MTPDAELTKMRAMVQDARILAMDAARADLATLGFIAHEHRQMLDALEVPHTHTTI